MVLQIQFQVCGLILVCMILAFCLRKNILSFTSERVFFTMILLVLGSLILDITSVWALYELFDDSLLKGLLCKGYLLSLISICCVMAYYVMMDIRQLNESRDFRAFICSVPVFASAIALIFLPIAYCEDNGLMYTGGESVILTYVVCCSYLLVALFLAIRYRRAIRKSKLEALVFLICSWILAATVQKFNDGWLIVGYAMALSMTFVYARMENPENRVDRLTRCFNADALYYYILERFTSKRTFSIITICLDDFKIVHETFGKENAERVMELVVSFLRSMKGCVAFRSGEYEFTLTFDNVKRMYDALEQIEPRFKRPWQIYEMDVKLSLSMAYLAQSNMLKSADELTDVVSFFMEECRKLGKGTVIPINEEQLLRKKEIDHADASLRRAMEQGTVQVYYQPIYSVRTGEYVSAEALVRLFDEDDKFISPDLFIPISERNGLILELGMIVFEQVCQFMKEQSLLEKGIRYVEVNLSVVQCMQEDLHQELMAVMQKYDIPPEAINLEITETAAVNSEKTLLSNMEALIAEGVTFSLDDYGSGYSNLSYVVGLPVDIVKLDKTLIWSSFESQKADVAMQFAISMIKSLGMSVLAEGVENVQQYRRMEALGVDYIQGYLFSRPLPKEEFVHVISQKIDALD